MRSYQVFIPNVPRLALLKPGPQRRDSIPQDTPPSSDRSAATNTAALDGRSISAVTWAQSYAMLLELAHLVDRTDSTARTWLELTLPSLRRALGEVADTFAAPVRRLDYDRAAQPVQQALALCLQRCGNPG